MLTLTALAKIISNRYLLITKITPRGAPTSKTAMDGLCKTIAVKVNKRKKEMSPLQGRYRVTEYGEPAPKASRVHSEPAPRVARVQSAKRVVIVHGEPALKQPRVLPFKVQKSEGPADIDFLRSKCGFIMPPEEQVVHNAKNSVGKRKGKICPKTSLSTPGSSTTRVSKKTMSAFSLATSARPTSIRASDSKMLRPLRLASTSLANLALANIRRQELMLEKVGSTMEFNHKSNERKIRFLESDVDNEEERLKNLQTKMTEDRRRSSFKAKKNPFATDKTAMLTNASLSRIASEELHAKSSASDCLKKIPSESTVVSSANSTSNDDMIILEGLSSASRNWSLLKWRLNKGSFSSRGSASSEEKSKALLKRRGTPATYKGVPLLTVISTPGTQTPSQSIKSVSTERMSGILRKKS